MAKFSKKKILNAHPSQIIKIAEAIQKELVLDGFDVNIDNLMSDGCDISITKGGMFKAVLGMRSALKITLTPQTDSILFDANVGIYGQQAIPTIISMFFFWPVLITQIWGLVKQSKLDDRVLEIAEKAITSKPEIISNDSLGTYKFCTNCGAQIENKVKFCPECGTRQ